MADIYETQHCYVHNQQCRLDQGASLEVAGLPCWDYSSAGKRLAENGPTVGTFICHAKRHIHTKTPLIILENVKDKQSGFMMKTTCSMINLMCNIYDCIMRSYR